jgi:hypothetical protein
MYGAPPCWMESEIVLHQARSRLMAALLPGLPEDEQRLVLARQKSGAARVLKRHLQNAAAIADVSFLGECLQTAGEVRAAYFQCFCRWLADACGHGCMCMAIKFLINSIVII